MNEPTEDTPPADPARVYITQPQTDPGTLPLMPGPNAAGGSAIIQGHTARRMARHVAARNRNN